MNVSTATLTALHGAPLADARVRDVVIAAATSLAERSGVRLVRVQADDRTVQAVLEADEVVAVGFAAELRRITGEWWRSKRPGEELWGESHDNPQWGEG